MRTLDKTQGYDTLRKQVDPADVQTNIAFAPAGGFCCSRGLIYATGLTASLPEGRGLGRMTLCGPVLLSKP